MASGQENKSTVYIGESSMILASLFFATTAILVKFASQTFSGLFIALTRFVISGIILIAMIFFSKGGWKIVKLKAWLLRGIFGAIAMVCYYIAIQINGSGRATLLQCTYPVFVMLTGLFFKKKPTLWHLISLIITIAGIFLVFYDGSSFRPTGDILALLSAATAGIAVNYIRILRATEHSPQLIYLPACLFGSLVALFSIGEISQVHLNTIWPLILIACLVLIAQLTMTFGYKYVSANRGSLLSLLVPPLTILFSFFLGEEMKSRFFIGSTVILAGLVIQKIPHIFNRKKNNLT